VILRVVAHFGALLPLTLLLLDWALDQFGANPIREVQLRTGRYALTLLALSLASSPVSRALGVPALLPLRRTLGLYAFAYASLHFLNFLVIDYGLDFGLIREDIFEKRFALAGLASFLVLLPLAVTSTSGWVRRLGKSWVWLHRLVYLAAILAVIHFLWQTRGDFTRPLIYAVVVVALLAARLPAIRRAVVGLRARAGQRLHR
jgi:sulfoxide reductase heme-binding subunit YedZ